MVRVYFCPRCKSVEVRYTFGLGNLFGVLPKMKCFKCGYTCSGFPILEVDKEKLKKVGSKTTLGLKKKEHGFSRKTRKTRRRK